MSRTSVPITGVVSEHVAESFDGLETEADLALPSGIEPEPVPFTPASGTN